MLLNELIGVKRFHGKSTGDLIKMARRFGIKFVGSGEYGQVFTHDRWPYVIKIIENDPAYLDFIDFVIKHPSKHYPKIVKRPLKLHKFHTREDSGKDFLWVIKVEKLKELHAEIARFIADYLENASSLLNRMEHGKDELDREAPKIEYRMPDGSVMKIQQRELFDRVPWFKSLCKAYMEISLHVDWSPDIKEDNFMMRDDGTIVIIDPVWVGETPQQVHDRFMRAELDLDDFPEFTSGPSYKRKQRQAPRREEPELEDIPF